MIDYFGKSPWFSEVYGYGKWLRKYGYYPYFLPLKIMCEHSGPNFQHLNGIPQADLEYNFLPYFTHSEHKCKEWTRLTGKPAYIIPNPFLFYLEQTKLKRSPKAKGTIVYPYHVIPNIKYIYDVKSYAEQLRNLPSKLGPFTISLHFHDINMGLKNEWEKEGFNVVTAGNPYDKNFIENFFKILSQHERAISNHVGSYVFYSVAFNTPFFIYGDTKYIKPISFKDKKTKGYYEEANKFDFLNILSIPRLNEAKYSDIIPSEFKKYVDDMINYPKKIKRLHFSWILYKSLFKNIIRK